MIHYLIAAGIGAAVSAVAYVGVQLWTGKPITVKGVLLSTVGGIVAGVLCATPGGVAALQAGGARALTFVAADGAAASGAEKMAENFANKKPLGEGVPEAVAWGTATAPVAYLGLRGYTQQLAKVFFPASAAAYASADASLAAGANVEAGSAAAVEIAGRHGARMTAVNIANAIAITGGNPAVARAITGDDSTAPNAVKTKTTDTTATPTPPAPDMTEQPYPEDSTTSGLENEARNAPSLPARGVGMTGVLGDRTRSP